MKIHAAITPLAQEAETFIIGETTNVSLSLSAIHVLHTVEIGSHQILQPNPNLPNFTFLQSSLVKSDLSYLKHPDSSEGIENIDSSHSSSYVDLPVPISINYRNLQQGPWKIPCEVGTHFGVIGSLSVTQSAIANPITVIVRELLSFDYGPHSPSFGHYVPIRHFVEDEVDISNLNFASWIVKLEVLS